jgi:hypothetical protein
MCFKKKKKVELTETQLNILRFLDFADEWMRKDSDIKELRFVRIPKEEQEGGGAISALNILRYSHND